MAEIPGIRISGSWRRTGEVWIVGLGRSQAPLRDSKGMRAIAHLLERPGQEVSALDLVALTEGHGRGSAITAAAEGLSETAGGDAGVLLDAQAKAEYRRRLDEVREELEEAERFNDPERADRARGEIAFLAQELASAVGLGGRDRRAGAATERARVNITRSIKTAIDRIDDHDADLAAHLRSAIRTGTHCEYAPSPVDRVGWDFTGGATTEQRAAPERRHRSVSSLLERDDEIAAIAAVLDSATAGSGGALAVTGAAGLGKTALLDETRGLATARGFTVLHARGRESETAFTFGVVRQLFDPALEALSQADRDIVLRGSVTPAAAMLGYGQAGDDGDAVSGFAVLNALYWLAVGLAGDGALALVVDDVHWADTQSSSWLAFMAARTEDVPIAVIVGARASGDGADAAGAVLPAAGVLEVRPLSQAAAATVVRRAWPQADDAFCTAAHGASAGNPFYLNELVSAARAAGMQADAVGAERLRTLTPDSVTRSIAARVRALDEQAVALARACALLGPSDAAVAGAVAGLSPGDELAAADRLAASGLLADHQPLEFPHPLVRSAVERSVPLSVRTQMHEQAAHLLAEQGAPADAIAAHLLHSRPQADAGAVAHLRAAARQAQLHGRPQSAVALLERALAEPPPPAELAAILLELARARNDSGEGATAFAVIERAMALGPAPDVRTALALELSRNDTLDLGERLDRLEAELRSIPADARDLRFDLEARVVDLLATAAIAASTPGSRARYGERLKAIAQDATGGTVNERILLAQFAAWGALQGEITAVEAKDLALRALDDGALDRRLAQGDWECSAATEVLMMVEAYPAADRHARAVEVRARARGLTPAEGYACVQRATIALLAGNLAQAEALLRSAFALLAGSGNDYALHVAHQTAALVALERDELDRASEHAATLAASSVSPVGGPHMRGRIFAARGEHDLAVAELQAAYELQSAAGRKRNAYGSVGTELAISLAAVGRREEAVALAAAELESARAFGAAAGIGAALRAAALVRTGAARQALLEESVATLAGSPALLQRVRSLHALAFALITSGADAEPVLAQALALADRVGASRMAAAIRAELDALGAPAPPSADPGAALTPGERRVAQLAADGASELEIAQALMITVPAAADLLAGVHEKLRAAGLDDLRSAFAV